jgi:hypothetical protein
VSEAAGQRTDGAAKVEQRQFEMSVTFASALHVETKWNKVLLCRLDIYKETDAKASKLRAHCGRVRERLVKLFAQHGFSDGLKTVEGLRKELIDGVIFSPRDITPEKLRESASKFTESAPISERLFDPQYYATLSALDPLSRTGYLQEQYSCYFVPRRYDQLLRIP